MQYFIITCSADGRTFSKRIAAKSYEIAMQIAIACMKGYVLESVRLDTNVA